MWVSPQARGPTLMRGGLEKSGRKFYAGRANPARFLQAKCGAGLCGAGQPALSPLKNVHQIVKNSSELKN